MSKNVKSNGFINNLDFFRHIFNGWKNGLSTLSTLSTMKSVDKSGYFFFGGGVVRYSGNVGVTPTLEMDE